MNARRRRLLHELFALPTAPFREQQVRDYCCAQLRRWQVPHFIDPVGNLIVGAAGQRGYERLVQSKSSEPLRLFIAHMDHPGFHGSRWLTPRRLAVRWHGGSPVKHLNGARIWLSAGSGYVGHGVLAKPRLTRERRSLATAEVVFPDQRVAAKHPDARALFGGFAFRAPVWSAGGRVYTKAADDLAGVFCVLELARESVGTGARRAPFLGLLTRAEEVGFVGALQHLELGWLSGCRRPLLAVSLEASRTLPGAVIGAGPVVRLGDRRTVFDADSLNVLSDLAMRKLRGKHQRRIMDGGACEGTVATAFGLPVVALSVPLGNYHNQGFEGGPGCKYPMGPAPEFIHLDDLEGQLSLCQALLTPKLAWNDPWGGVRARLLRNSLRYVQLMNEGSQAPEQSRRKPAKKF